MSAYKSIKSRRSAHSSVKASLRKRRVATGQHPSREAEAEAELQLGPAAVATEAVATEAAVATGEPTFAPPVLEPSLLLSGTIATTWTRLADSRSRMRTGLGSIREHAKEAARKRRRPRRDGFFWYEREWEERFWVRRTRLTPRALLTFALVLVVSLFVLLIAARAASRTAIPSARSSNGSNADPIIIQHEGYWDPPIPVAPAYAVGVWVSDMSPPASGVEEVYVEVTRNPDGPTVKPVANIPVKISSENGVAYGVVKTNASGLAVFTFFYGSVPGSPVYLTATATIDRHTYSSTTDFVTG
jgi:hypothetical protein